MHNTLPPYEIDTSKLRAEYTNMYRTEGLFLERGANGRDAIFTFKEHDNIDKGLYSFHRLYLEIGDLTEYSTAMILLGSTQHWDRLLRCKWFTPILEKCRKDLKAKIRGEALKQIADTAMNTSSDTCRLSALKFLAKEGIDLFEENDTKNTKSKRGRPSKAEVASNLVQLSKEEKDVMKDMERVLN